MLSPIDNCLQKKFYFSPVQLQVNTLTNLRTFPIRSSSKWSILKERNSNFVVFFFNATYCSVVTFKNFCWCFEYKLWFLILWLLFISACVCMYFSWFFFIVVYFFFPICFLKKERQKGLELVGGELGSVLL